ncbi:MAG TPA: hypothetical protein VFH83_06615 [Spirochaetia bacterium]|nr:hypothetical protein [Spirochaetia bacterium]
MFENIIGQTETLHGLSEEIAAGILPRAILFAGPAYSGKLSTALEVARILTCIGDNGAWTCECSSCRQQKELSHPQTVLLGSRYSEVEIAASAGSLLASRRPVTQYLFLRAVRKLTRRFDPSIFDAEDTRVRATREKAAAIEELLSAVEPGRELGSERELTAQVDEILGACLQLLALQRADGVSIAQVRRLASWAHLGAGGQQKVAIIENADRLQDSARNALLKLLEEPPQSVHFLLLSTRRAAIAPTILSRLRPYAFRQRDAAEEREVLARVFHVEDAPYDSLRAFFMAWRALSPERVSILAKRFLELVDAEGNGGRADILNELAELTADSSGKRERGARRTAASQREAALAFLEELTVQLSARLRAAPDAPESAEQGSEAIREAVTRIDALNISPPLVLESLFYRMAEDARSLTGKPAAEAGSADAAAGAPTIRSGDP